MKITYKGEFEFTAGSDFQEHCGLEMIDMTMKVIESQINARHKNNNFTWTLDPVDDNGNSLLAIANKSHSVDN